MSPSNQIEAEPAGTSVAVPEVVSIPLSDRGCRDCEGDDPDCPERWVYVGELARRAGVTRYKILKWTGEKKIPHRRLEGERTMYPIRRALEAIREFLNSGS